VERLLSGSINYKDINELEKHIDKSFVLAETEYRKNVKLMREKFISPAITAEQVYEKILLQRQTGDKGHLTGIEWWDEFAGPFRRGNTYVLAGYPGVGKTTLALNWAWSMAKKNLRIWYFCLELTASEVFEVMAGLISKKSTVTEADETFAYAAIQGTGFRFYEPSGYLDWEKQLKIICNTVRKESIDIVFIDNLSFLTRSIRNTFEVENVASARIKGLSQELSIPIILLHHLRKPESDVIEPEPNIHAMRGSGAILADASDAYLLHHPINDDESQSRSNVGYILSGKPRWGMGGKRYVRMEKRNYYSSTSASYPKRTRRKKYE